MAYGGGTPTGTVTFLDGQTVLGTVAVTPGGMGAQATFTTSGLSLGSHSVTAAYGGDQTFAGSTSSVLTENVQLLSTSTSLHSNANPSYAGQPVTFTASIQTTGNATGQVSFYNGTTLLGVSNVASNQASLTTSALAAGSYSITADYGGDSSHAAAASPVLTQTVQMTPTSTSVYSSADPSQSGQLVTFTASVTTNGSATGTVSFYDGSTLLDTAAVSNNMATFTTSALSVGSHSILATYSGDGNHAGSTSAALGQQVDGAQQSQTGTMLSSSSQTAPYGQPVTFTAVVEHQGNTTPTGTVSFYDGSTLLATVNVTNGSAAYTVSTLSEGSHMITAVYSGDSDYDGSTSSPFDETIQ